jgi:hypothetical protein
MKESDKRADVYTLKTDVSVVLLHHFADKANMTFDDYCSVYDSEEHEKILNKILRVVLVDRERYAKQSRVDEIYTLIGESKRTMFGDDSALNGYKLTDETVDKRLNTLTEDKKRDSK